MLESQILSLQDDGATLEEIIHGMERRYSERDEQMAVINTRMSEYEINLASIAERLEESSKARHRSLQMLRKERQHKRRVVRDELASLRCDVATITKDRRRWSIFNDHLLSLTKRIGQLEACVWSKPEERNQMRDIYNSITPTDDVGLSIMSRADSSALFESGDEDNDQ